MITISAAGTPNGESTKEIQHYNLCKKNTGRIHHIHNKSYQITFIIIKSLNILSGIISFLYFPIKNILLFLVFLLPFQIFSFVQHASHAVLSSSTALLYNVTQPAFKCLSGFLPVLLQFMPIVQILLSQWIRAKAKRKFLIISLCISAIGSPLCLLICKSPDLHFGLCFSNTN